MNLILFDLSKILKTKISQFLYSRSKFQKKDENYFLIWFHQTLKLILVNKFLIFDKRDSVNIDIIYGSLYDQYEDILT